MGTFYETFLRPQLFKRDAESAHEFAVNSLAMLSKVGPLCWAMEQYNRLHGSLQKPVRCFGIDFPNRVGIAAGFDKHARCWPAAAALGFGHVEVGTVTRHAQEGNEKPRLFRFPEHEAVLNRMGFNNEGAAAIAARLAKRPPRGKRAVPLGINLGKSKITPVEDAVSDYLESFRLLAPHADYVAINVSSPNTPGLRKLQERGPLIELLGALQAANNANGPDSRRPLLLKIAPDLTWQQIDDILNILTDLKLDGIIATNTTIAREGVFADLKEAGGLSGRLLQRRSTDIINYIARATNGRLPIIGVGGICDVAAAGEKLDAGATLVQIYSGWIYRGPFFGRDVAWALARR